MAFSNEKDLHTGKSYVKAEIYVKRKGSTAHFISVMGLGSVLSWRYQCIKACKPHLCFDLILADL